MIPCCLLSNVVQRVLHPEQRGGLAMAEGMSLSAGEASPDPRTPARDGDPATDVRLMAALAAGDRQALGQLYDRQGPLLLALGLRMLGDRAVAEDVLHDVFLEAWHHAREFDPARGTVRAWLVTRMRSRCLDRRTTAVRQHRLAEDAARQQDTIAQPDEGARPGTAPASAASWGRCRPISPPCWSWPTSMACRPARLPSGCRSPSAR